LHVAGKRYTQHYRLWQVSTRSEGDLKVQELADTYYIRNWSLCWMCIFCCAWLTCCWRQKVPI